MLRWLDEVKLRRGRRRFKGLIVKKGLAGKLKRRRRSPPPTPRLVEPSDWEQQVEEKIYDVEDPSWWLQNVREPASQWVPLAAHLRLQSFDSGVE